MASDAARQGGHRHPEGLGKFRRYAYVGMFVVAAVLAPPDVFTQTGLALPLIALYEVSDPAPG